MLKIINGPVKILFYCCQILHMKKTLKILISYLFMIPVKDYIDIFGDDSELLINGMINVFDNSSSTCMNLPVQGNTPPVFWARINTTILNINLQSFTITVEGEGISCVRHGADKVLQVSVSFFNALLYFFFIDYL